jgi:hypothetical protein
MATMVLLTQAVLTIWIVPDWSPSLEPTYTAAVSALATTMVLLAWRASGRRGTQLELRVLAVFLAAMPLVYVASWLRSPDPGWLPIELAAVPIYALVAWHSRRSPYLLGAGIAAHGLLWDVWHAGHSSYIPTWYAIGCMIVDVGLGAYLVLEAPQFRAARAPVRAPAQAPA